MYSAIEPLRELYTDIGKPFIDKIRVSPFCKTDIVEFALLTKIPYRSRWSVLLFTMNVGTIIAILINIVHQRGRVIIAATDANSTISITVLFTPTNGIKISVVNNDPSTEPIVSQAIILPV